jgi:hypothetical protein
MLILAICEYYNPCLHGQDDNSSPGIDGHILCAYSVPHETVFHRLRYPFRFFGGGANKTYWWDVRQTAYWKNCANGEFLDTAVANNLLAYGHPTIRNYFPIIRSRGIRSLEIAELHYLEPGGECVCVLKTFWIRVFQRKVQNWIRNKARVSAYLKKSKQLLMRECGMMNGMMLTQTHIK